MVDDQDPEPVDNPAATVPGRTATGERVIAAPPVHERATPDHRHIALKRVLGVVVTGSKPH